jgi:hypothetical protein
MDRKIIEAGVHMVSLMLEELAPAEEKASVRRLMKRIGASSTSSLRRSRLKLNPRSPIRSARTPSARTGTSRR